MNISLGIPLAGPAVRWSPRQLIAAYPGTQWFEPGPSTVFTDTAGTTAATFGQGVGGLRVPGGAVVATQSDSGFRPIYGRHPAAGRHNMLPNSTPTGAVLGVLGSGGALPTGWDSTFVSGGAATIEVVGIGLDYVDIAVDFTASSGDVVFRIPGTAALVPAAQNQDWYFSLGVALLSGSINGAPALRGTQRDIGGSSVGALTFNTSISLTGDVQRFGGTAQITAATAARMNADFRVASTGTWNATFRLSRPQLERGTVQTAIQDTRSGGFDVTEAGQRSVYYLRQDGVDDFMSLATAFAPAGAFTIATARRFLDLAALSTDACTTFGRSGDTNSFFTRTTASQMRLRTNTATNRIVGNNFGAADTALNTVDVARVDSAAAGGMWRNGIPAGSIDIDGAITPLQPFNTLFRRGASGFGGGFFYGAIAVPAAITEPERLFSQRYLAGRSAGSLA